MHISERIEILAYYSKCNSGLSAIIDFLRIRKYNEVSVYLKQNY